MNATRALFALGWIMLAGVACDAHVGDPPARHAATTDEPVHNAVDAMTHRRKMVGLAEQALAQRHSVDYQRPFKATDEGSADAENLYLAACREGDKQSCWIAATLGHWAAHSEASALVAANCKAGDRMSCRALPLYHTEFEQLPGGVGRAYGCNLPSPDERPCDLVAARRECLDGFPFGCWALRRVTLAEMPDVDQLLQRFDPLALAGCRAWISDECRLLHVSDVERERQPCLFKPYSCAGLRATKSSSEALMVKRDLMERGCQYSGRESYTVCLDLAELYEEGSLPEPVPGRAQALIAWACSDSTIRETSHTCKSHAASLPGKRPK